MNTIQTSDRSREQARAPARPAWRASLVSGFAKVADILLPPVCLSCREPVDAHDGLCASCWSEIDFIVAPMCDRLGIPLSYATDDVIVSAAAVASPPVYDRARAVARYNATMRSLIHGLKYADRHEGLKVMGRWLHKAGDDLIEDTDLIVPVPLARTRLWSRRFNQSAMLAAGLARRTGLPSDPFALVRTRRTVSQVGLTAEQRKRNVSGAFQVPQTKRPDIEGRNILLIDDVITTGATADACARTLKRAGAARVDVLALARVVDPLAPTI